MKIVNYKKFFRSILVLCIIVMIIIVFNNKTFSYQSLSYSNITVQEGDTLWIIASRLQKNNSIYKDRDIRFIIDDIKTINNLSSGSIYTNQELKIPST